MVDAELGVEERARVHALSLLLVLHALAEIVGVAHKSSTKGCRTPSVETSFLTVEKGGQTVDSRDDNVLKNRNASKHPVLEQKQEALTVGLGARGTDEQAAVAAIVSRRWLTRGDRQCIQLIGQLGEKRQQKHVGGGTCSGGGGGRKRRSSWRRR